MEPIEVIFYIEGLSNDRKALESAMGQTAESLKAEKDVEIRDIYVDEIVEDPDNDLLPYSGGMIEARIRGGRLKSSLIWLSATLPRPLILFQQIALRFQRSI